MKRPLEQLGVCDCHSHVFGPFSRFPLSPERTFDPPNSPIDRLEDLWSRLGVDRAVLVQGSAHSNDHSALLDALARAPESRRGVALLHHTVSDSCISQFHEAGIRALRFNWIPHLLGKDQQTIAERLRNAANLLERVAHLGWHAEVHIDVANLGLIAQLDVPAQMPVVIDHMARIDASAYDYSAQISKLLNLIKRDHIWIKLSGADRVAARVENIRSSAPLMRALIEQASARCVWGLDWPHVNLAKQVDDSELAHLLIEVCSDEVLLQKILVHNPERLYGFSPL
jgi:predicted TIM-barrel fold metal-dependent hydrolase